LLSFSGWADAQDLQWRSDVQPALTEARQQKKSVVVGCYIPYMPHRPQPVPSNPELEKFVLVQADLLEHLERRRSRHQPDT